VPFVLSLPRYHQLNQDVYCCFEKWVDSAAPPAGKSKSKGHSAKEPTLARFVGGGGLTTSKLSAVGKRNSHKDKVVGKSKMHVWCVFDGHDMMGEVAAQIAAQTFEQHLNNVRPIPVCPSLACAAPHLTFCTGQPRPTASAYDRA